MTTHIKEASEIAKIIAAIRHCAPFLSDGAAQKGELGQSAGARREMGYKQESSEL